MTFIKYYLKYLFFLLVIGTLFSETSILVAVVVFIVVGTFYSEYHKFHSTSGRQQIYKEQEEQRKIEEYWGTIDYNDK